MVSGERFWLGNGLGCWLAESSQGQQMLFGLWQQDTLPPTPPRGPPRKLCPCLFSPDRLCCVVFAWPPPDPTQLTLQLAFTPALLSTLSHSPTLHPFHPSTHDDKVTLSQIGVVTLCRHSGPSEVERATTAYRNTRLVCSCFVHKEPKACDSDLF